MTQEIKINQLDNGIVWQCNDSEGNLSQLVFEGKYPSGRIGEELWKTISPMLDTDKEVRIIIDFLEPKPNENEKD